MDLPAVIQRGKELRKKGYRLIQHEVFSDSVEIPGGEQFDEARLNVRYNMADNKDELEEAKEYLMLCETILARTSTIGRGYELN